MVCKFKLPELDNVTVHIPFCAIVGLVLESVFMGPIPTRRTVEKLQNKAIQITADSPYDFDTSPVQSF